MSFPCALLKQLNYKQHNVLISDNKSPMLADFGLSLMLSQTQATTGTTSSIGGTVRWMAKELFQSSSNGSPKYDEATDIWAYGMIAYVRTCFIFYRKKLPISTHHSPGVTQLEGAIF